MARWFTALALALVLASTGCGGSDEDPGAGGGSGGSIHGGGGDGGSVGPGGSGGDGGSGGGTGGEGGGPPRPPPNPHAPETEVQDWDCDGLTDAEEFGTVYPGGGKTSPTDPDSDGDGIPDGVEVGRTSSPDPACAHFTGDADPATRTDPTNPDTDGDGIPDGLEDRNANGRVDRGESDPLLVDSDGDGIPDGVEDRNRNGIVDPGETDPSRRDSDGDGIPDGVEDRNRNGVVDPGETDPTNPDTDGDGIPDGDEDLNWNGIVDPGETDPLVPQLDSDGDGLLDEVELRIGTDPHRADTDGDGLPDGLEDKNGDGVLNAGETDPLSPDTDCDGLSDGEEDANRNGLVDPGETDPRVADSDGDLLPDGLERGRTSSPDPTCSFVGDADPSTTTDPLRADTDGDGINDGMEDRNRNGRVDDGETDPADPDTDGDGIPDGQEDRNGNGRVDPGETDPRTPDIDTDGDGITDDIERNVTGTDPNRADTDGDGLPDGLEDRNQDGVVNRGETDPLSADTDCDGLSDGEEDRNRNGIVDPGETDPTNPDTDGDGILDGVELGRTSSPDPSCGFVGDADPSTTTDPLDPDTDGDGIQDGAEDANRNGRRDDGELDPRNPADASDTTVAACSLQNLAPVTLHVEGEADVILATRPTYSEVSTVTAGGAAKGKMVFAPRDATLQPAPMAGFAVVKQPAGTTAADEEAAFASRFSGVSSPVVQTFTTWDGYPAVRALYDLSGSGDLKARANQIVQHLVPGASGLLTGSAGSNGPFKLQMEFVLRSPQRAVVVGSLVRAAEYTGDNLWRLDDVANGSALAQYGDQTNVACDRFTASEWPKIDFLWVIDNSGSMDDDQQALANAATLMGQQLDGAAIDWRIAVITTDLDQRGTGNKRLANFTRSIATFQSDARPGTGGSGTERGFAPVYCAMAGRNSPVPSGVSCHDTVANGHFLPAEDGRNDRLRPDAQLVVVFVSDEVDSSGKTIDDWVQYFSDYDPYRPGAQRAIVTGILTCDAVNGTRGLCDDPNLSRRYTELIQRMGGIQGDLTDLSTMEATISELINSVIGVTSRYPLTGSPISATIKVAIDAGSQVGPNCDPADVPRSRTHGFDYSGASNQIAFFGDCRPASGSDANIAVSYRTWVDRSFDPDGTPIPCGGCEAPYECNPYTQQCECPSDCGGGAPGPSWQCDTATCTFVCPEDCGGDPPVPGMACDRASCTFVCPEDCGGPAPGPGFVCDRATCTWACDETCGGQTKPGENFVCNRTSCTWECPPDCGQGFTENGLYCDRLTCTLGCAPDCGGLCTGNTVCDPVACACECQQAESCAEGFSWSPEACACVVDPGTIECDGNRVVDPVTGACVCPADCGGCESGAVCNRASCTCIDFG